MQYSGCLYGTLLLSEALLLVDEICDICRTLCILFLMFFNNLFMKAFYKSLLQKPKKDMIHILFRLLQQAFIKGFYKGTISLLHEWCHYKFVYFRPAHVSFLRPP